MSAINVFNLLSGSDKIEGTVEIPVDTIINPKTGKGKTVFSSTDAPPNCRTIEDVIKTWARGTVQIVNWKHPVDTSGKPRLRLKGNMQAFRAACILAYVVAIDDESETPYEWLNAPIEKVDAELTQAGIVRVPRTLGETPTTPPNVETPTTPNVPNVGNRQEALEQATQGNAGKGKKQTV